MKHIRYHKSKYFYYLGIKKSTLIVALILALIIIGGLFIFRGLAGQRTILTPVGEGITPTGIPAEKARKPFPNTAVVTWYGTGENECLGCQKYYDENGLYYLMRNGERLNDNEPTVAHRTLPLGTKVKFLRDEGDGSGFVAEAIVTDRGPFIEGKTFDLSKAVFERLAPLSKGSIVVRWEIVED